MMKKESVDEKLNSLPFQMQVILRKNDEERARESEEKRREERAGVQKTLREGSEEERGSVTQNKDK